jgi:hypothetical protein
VNTGEKKVPIKGAGPIIDQAVKENFGFEPTKLEVEPLNDYPGGTWEKQYRQNPELWDERIQSGRLRTQLFGAKALEASAKTIKDLTAKNTELDQKFQDLEQQRRKEKLIHKEEIDGLNVRLQAAADEINGFGERMEDMRKDFETRLAELQTQLDEEKNKNRTGDFFDLEASRSIKRWRPKVGDEIPLDQNGEKNTSTTVSINPVSKTAVVKNSDGTERTVALKVLGNAYQREQVRKEAETRTQEDDPSVKGWMRRTYNRITRRGESELVPVVIYTEDGEAIVVNEEVPVVDQRKKAFIAVLGVAALVGVGALGYALGEGSNHKVIVTPPAVTRTVPARSNPNMEAIDKNRYKLLLHEEEQLGAVEAANARLRGELKAEKQEEQAEHKSEVKGLNSIVINMGNGYTQEIQDSFPGHSGSQYFKAYRAALNHYGRDFIRGVPKYKMTDGNWGLGRPGPAQWAPNVRNFLKGFFANHS